MNLFKAITKSADTIVLTNITPVCKGSNTDCLSIIPIAGDSITH